MKSSDEKGDTQKMDTSKEKRSITSTAIENPCPVSKKRKIATKSSSSTSTSSDSSAKKSTNQNLDQNGFKTLSLSDLKKSAEAIHERVPPESMPDDTTESVRAWARQMQAVLEEFNLLIACVSPSTYKWGTDRSGAADQNLSLLFSEINSAQDQISSSVTTRIR